MRLISEIIDKFRHAFRGVFYGLRNDNSIVIQALIATMVILFSLFLKVSRDDFIIILILCTLVLLSEFFNSAIEMLADFTCGKQHHEEIKNIKDLTAGAVLIMSLISVVVGIMVIYKYIF